MNKLIMRMIMISLVCVFCLSITACNGCSKGEEERTNWTFANHASQTVYLLNITPNGQPDFVELKCDTTVDVTITGDELDYDYGPANSIARRRTENDNVISFYDLSADAQ